MGQEDVAFWWYHAVGFHKLLVRLVESPSRKHRDPRGPVEEDSVNDDGRVAEVLELALIFVVSRQKDIQDLVVSVGLADVFQEEVVVPSYQ